MAQRTKNIRIIELGVAQANINAVDLNLAVAALAQENARLRVREASYTDLTDSSTGTAAPSSAGATPLPLVAVVTPTVVAQNGVALLYPKAAFDTQIGLIEDAHREIITRVNEYITVIAKGSPLVEDLTLGATVNNTVAAITPLATGSAAADQGVDAATGIAQIVAARNNQAAISAAISWVCFASGVPPLSDGTGGVFTKTQSLYETTDAAATAAAAAAGADSLTEASVEAAMTALVNNIATMCRQLAELNDPAIGTLVVATSNPRTRFSIGDTDIN